MLLSLLAFELSAKELLDGKSPKIKSQVYSEWLVCGWIWKLITSNVKFTVGDRNTVWYLHHCAYLQTLTKMGLISHVQIFVCINILVQVCG